MSKYYIEMYNFPEDKEWKDKDMYFTSIQNAVKYFNEIKKYYSCATIGEEIWDPCSSKMRKVRRVYYERIIKKDGTIKVKDNRSLFNLKTLNKI